MNLTSDDSLRAIIEKVDAVGNQSSDASKRIQEICSYLEEIAALKAEGAWTTENLQRLFDDETLSATGQGNISLANAYADGQFRAYVTSVAAQQLPIDKVARVAQLEAIYDQLAGLAKQHCSRVPWLKIARAMTALFPHDFTTLAHTWKLKVLNKLLGGTYKEHPVQAHRNILDRFEHILGPVPENDREALARRLRLSWSVYVETQRDNTSSGAGEDVDSEALFPLPANRRKKGLLAMAGYFPTLLGYLEEVGDGVTREELVDAIRAGSPNLKDSSIGTVINALQSEFDVIKREADQYVLTARGVTLLETQDADELSDFLLTRVLGVDHLMVSLADAPRAKSELYAVLQRANPGWTSTFAPSAMLSWLLSFGVVAKGNAGELYLTDLGKSWRQQVTWTPECLVLAEDFIDASPTAKAGDTFQLQNAETIVKRLGTSPGSSCVFPEASVLELHAALWSHPLRHFAVLAGISGSGKTQLARSYGLALCEGDESRVLVVPVQPGWFEPSALLGYVNPIEQEYSSTPFLNLLGLAASNPEVPYVVILDEMNLSHPEQYLAPILSAMETGCDIDIHQLPVGAGETPQRIKYPSNLAIIGTVNMDETTHGLSDKVLDRAHTMEFWDIDVEAYPNWDQAELPAEERQQLRELLASINAELAPMRLHFGWRTIDTIIRFISFSKANGTSFQAACDTVLYAKVLPKLRGEDSQRFRTALNNVQAILRAASLHRCGTKITELLFDLNETGSARFWR